MRWLMAQAGGRPVIEYCGGTEIGGGYITGTVTLPCVAGTFNTPALGLDFVILDEAGRPADNGELFLVPPSIGLSDRAAQQGPPRGVFRRRARGPARRNAPAARRPDGARCPAAAGAATAGRTTR